MKKRYDWPSIATRSSGTIAFGLILLLITGCSNSKGGTSSTAAASANAGSIITTTTENLGSGGGSFCDVARQYQKDQDNITNQATAAGAAAGQSGNMQAVQSAGDAAALKSAKDSEALFPKMISLAPSSLKGDLQIIWNASKPLLDATIQTGGDMSKLPQSTQQQLASSMSDPKFTAAAQALENYGVQTCGFPTTTTSSGQ